MTKHSSFNTSEIKRCAPLDVVFASYGIATKKDGSRLLARCPFHDDSTPSLVIDLAKQVWKCHGPCDVGGDVISFVMKKESIGFVDAAKKLAAAYGVAVETTEAARKKVAEYVYTDAAGVWLYTIERWEPGKEKRSKDFIQRLPDGTAKKCARQVLYKLPEIAKRPHDVVFVVEGEKCVDKLSILGVLATTAAGGTGAWRTWTPEFAAPLAGRKVVVIADNDEGGRKLAAHIVSVVHGIAAEVRELDLGLKGKGDDVVDWIAGGGTRAELLTLADKAPAAAAETAWRSQLLRTSTGEVRPSVGNALLAIQNADPFRGSFWFHERELAVYTDRALPWDKPKTPAPRQVTDDDPVFGAAWCERELKSPISVEGFGRALWATAGQRRRDPLVDNLRAQRWDKQQRAETWLIRHAGAKDTRFVRAVSKAWLIAAVARALSPGAKVDNVLVLESTQGKRKSSMLRALAGPGGFADSLPDVDSKDSALILGRTWILELAELESLRKSEVTQMNAFVTRTHDVFRPPYGRTTIEVPRRCVFAASTNEETYLRDPTGNRRWWPVAVGRIDYDGVVAEREQLWAEAVAAFDAGEPWWFADASLDALAKVETAEREETDPWEEQLAERLEGFEHTSIVGCFAHLSITDKARQSTAEGKRISKILRRMKWTRKQVRVGGRREWRYYAPPPDPPPPAGGAPPGGDDLPVTGAVTSVTRSVTSVTAVTSESLARARADAQQQLPGALESVVGPRTSIFTGDTGDNRDLTSTAGVTASVTADVIAAAAVVTDIVDDVWGGDR